MEYVKFPTPLRPFVTRSILVETFEVGPHPSGGNSHASCNPAGCDATGSSVLFQESEPISNYLRPEVPAHVKQRIARMGIETLLKMVRCMLGCWLATKMSLLRNYECAFLLNLVVERRMCNHHMALKRPAAVPDPGPTVWAVLFGFSCFDFIKIIN